MKTVLNPVTLSKSNLPKKPEGVLVDNFAGAGGASTGIEAALGQHIDVAINHSEIALATHKLNHPKTKHYPEDVFEIDPKTVCGSRPVRMAWFSPDCTHHSNARGGKPRDSKIRGLAWVVINWAKLPQWQRPKVIFLENVKEFQDWGPLDAGGKIIPESRGKTFLAWKSCLEDLGYHIEHRTLIAADYGAPTTRERFFLIARCDGKPIVWPKPTHAPAGVASSLGLKPYKTAAECIDWSIECPSIFTRKRPLAEKSMSRVFKGLQRFVIDNPDPFIVNEQSLIAPWVVKYYGGVTGIKADSPLSTITAVDHHALACAYLVKYYGNGGAKPLTEALDTITGNDRFGLVTAFIVKHYGCGTGQSLNESLHTLMGENKFGLVMVRGEKYKIADIGLRMLQPHELLKAQFGRFADNYRLHGSKRQRVKAIGNSVPPEVVEALVKANV